MALKINRLRTHWRVEDAVLIIDFLDELRYVLCETYADEIMAMHQAERDNVRERKEDEGPLPFDDDIEF